jgi:hypothetical protein
MCFYGSFKSYSVCHSKDLKMNTTNDILIVTPSLKDSRQYAGMQSD